MTKDLWALWPDSFMCPLEEIHYFSHRSDDFELVEVLTYDEDSPNTWRPYVPTTSH